MITKQITNNALLDYVIIIGFSIVSLILLIANPGYYSHDELQKLDHIYQFGLGNYFQNYVTVQVGDAFGTPVRPFSFAIQGILALFMENYPVIVHFFGVLSHALVASLLYTLILQFGGSRQFALISALVFVVNPMAILATGWSAALMDRLYILFGLIALLAADRYVRLGSKSIYLFIIFFAATLSILSKETALVTPFLISLILIAKFSLIKTKRFWIATGIWITPIFIFMLYRLPALINSFENPAVGAYKASFSNVAEGIWVYFSYPFLIPLTEAINWVFLEPYWLWFAITIHLLLMILLSLNHTIKYALFYFIFFFLFVSPVLLIPIKAAHYLYGSGLIFSVVIASLLLAKGKFEKISRFFGLSILIIILIHSYYLQGFVYKLGSCMNKVMIASEGIYYSYGKPDNVTFQAEPGAPEHVLHRLYTARNRIGNSFPIDLKVSNEAIEPESDRLLIIMNNECSLYVKEENKQKN
jgi:hypothetical protein